MIRTQMKYPASERYVSTVLKQLITICIAFKRCNIHRTVDIPWPPRSSSLSLIEMLNIWPQNLDILIFIEIVSIYQGRALVKPSDTLKHATQTLFERERQPINKGTWSESGLWLKNIAEPERASRTAKCGRRGSRTRHINLRDCHRRCLLSFN